MDKQQKYDKLYLDIAERVSEMSYAERKKVGAVIVKDGNIISFGWNGTPSGCDNECEDTLGKTLPYVIHAEQNAIYKLSKSTTNSAGSTLYVTLSPCITCALGIIQTGVERVIYKEEYSDISGIKFLTDSGVIVKQYKEYKFVDPDLHYYEDKVQNYLSPSPSSYFTYEEIWDPNGYHMNCGLATLFFDLIGRFPAEDDRNHMTYGEVNLILKKADNIHKVLTEYISGPVADHALENWKAGNHDT